MCAVEGGAFGQHMPHAGDASPTIHEHRLTHRCLPQAVDTLAKCRRIALLVSSREGARALHWRRLQSVLEAASANARSLDQRLTSAAQTSCLTVCEMVGPVTLGQHRRRSNAPLHRLIIVNLQSRVRHTSVAC